jgi:hypothetical protein
MYSNPSAIARLAASLIIWLLFRFNKKCHAQLASRFGRSMRDQDIFCVLLNAGKEQDIPMPVMSNFERGDHKTKNMIQYAMHCVDVIRPEDYYELIIPLVNVNQLADVLETLAPC